MTARSTSSSTKPVQLMSLASSLRYSSASRPTIDAFSRSGRSLRDDGDVAALGGQVAGDGQDAVVVVVGG